MALNNNYDLLHIDYPKLFKLFKEDSLFYQCYPGVLAGLGNLGRKTGEVYNVKDYAAIYSSTKAAVNQVLDSVAPEIDINACMTKFLDNDTEGYIQAMMFLIALYDSMEEKSDIVMETLQECRAALEEDTEGNSILENNPMWEMIANRIPPKDNLRQEDYISINKKLVNKIENLERIIKKKDEEFEKLNSGMIKVDNDFKPWSTGDRINVLYSLLNLSYPLVGEEREQFKKLCTFMTKAEDKTLERFLSQGELLKMEDKREELFNEYPILKESNR